VGKSSLISDLIHEGFQPTVQAVLPIVVLPPEGTLAVTPWILLLRPSSACLPCPVAPPACTFAFLRSCSRPHSRSSD